MLWTCHFPKGSEFLKKIPLHFNCRNVEKLNKLWNWGGLYNFGIEFFCLMVLSISVWNYFTYLIWIKIVFQCVSLVLLHDIVCLHHPTHSFSPLVYSLFFCTGVMTLHSWITRVSIDLLEVGTLPSYWEEIWSDCLNKRSQRQSLSLGLWPSVLEIRKIISQTWLSLKPKSGYISTYVSTWLRDLGPDWTNHLK